MNQLNFNSFKKRLGLKILVSIIFTLTINSCQKDDFITNKQIKLNILNNYFETLDSIYFNKEKIANQIDTGTIYTTHTIWKPLNNLKVYTSSNLIIFANIHINYHTEIIYITINKKGRISVK